jgi:hypothetical protein
MRCHAIYSKEKTIKNYSANQTDDITLLNSIMNVELNIFDYKERKKHCKNCSENKTKQTCQNCSYEIPNVVHLKIMQNRKKELWEEYNRRHKGEIRWNNTII